MANSVDRCAFNRTPAELRNLIAESCDIESLGNLIQTSKTCRNWFGIYYFREVRFEGDAMRLCEMLQYFVRNKTFAPLKGSTWFNIRNFIIKVTLVERIYATYQEQDTWTRSSNLPVQRPHYHPHLASNVLKAITLMPCLERLGLSLGDRTNSALRDLLKRVPPNRSLTHVKVESSPEHKLPEDLMEFCNPGGLIAFQFQTAHTEERYLELAGDHISPPPPEKLYSKLATLHPNLEKLHMTLAEDWTNNGEVYVKTPSMDPAFIEDLAIYFPKLRWLALCQIWDVSVYEQRMANNAQLATALNNLVKSIQKLPDLERFACTLWKSQMRNRVFNSAWQNDDLDVPDRVIDRFYLKMLRKLFRRLPQLKELCIMTEYPVIFRAIRHDNGLTTQGMEMVNSTKAQLRTFGEQFPATLWE